MMRDSRANPLPVIALRRRPPSITNSRPSGLAANGVAGVLTRPIGWTGRHPSGPGCEHEAESGDECRTRKSSVFSPELVALAAHTDDQNAFVSPGAPPVAETSVERGPTTGPGAYAATVK